MEGSAKQKVPGGKLLTVKMRYSGSIESIQLIGDFFVYPEDSLGYIEDGLRGLSTDSGEEQIAEKVSEIVRERGIEMVGITPEAIAHTIRAVVGR